MQIVLLSILAHSCKKQHQVSAVGWSYHLCDFTIQLILLCSYSPNIPWNSQCNWSDLDPGELIDLRISPPVTIRWHWQLFTSNYIRPLLLQPVQAVCSCVYWELCTTIASWHSAMATNVFINCSTWHSTSCQSHNIMNIIVPCCSGLTYTPTAPSCLHSYIFTGLFTVGCTCSYILWHNTAIKILEHTVYIQIFMQQNSIKRAQTKLFV